MPSRPGVFLRSQPLQFLLLLYIVTVPVMEVFHVKLGGQTLLLCDFIFVLVVLFSLPALLRRNLRPSFFEVLLLAYLGATVLSTLASDAGYMGVIKVGYLVSVAALTRRIVGSSLESATTAWLVGTSVAVIGSLVGVATFFLGWSDFLENPLLDQYGTLPPGPYPRVNSVFFNSNMLCNYLIVGMALAWYRGQRLFVGGILGASFFTFSPGLGGMALALGLSARRLRGAVAAGILAALLSLGAVLVSPGALLEGHLEPSARVLLWKQAIEIWAAHPITGTGPGAAGIELRYVVPSGMTKRSTDAHNVWLSVGSQMGSLGLAALLALIFYSMRKAPSPLPGLRDALRIALAGSWLIHGLSSSFEDSRHLWVLLGMLAATWETAGRGRLEASNWKEHGDLHEESAGKNLASPLSLC